MNAKQDDLLDMNRRRWLMGSAVAGAAAWAAPSGQAQAARLQTKAHVLIAGSGLGGLAVAHRLNQLLDGVRITIIDRKEEHNYQPGYTLVATGVWPVSKVRDRNADFMPAGVTWIKDMVAEFDPAGNAVVTASGVRVPPETWTTARGAYHRLRQYARGGLVEDRDLGRLSHHAQ